MDPAVEAEAGRRRRLPIGMVLAVATILGVVIVWIWAFAAGRSDPPGLLDDGGFGAAATRVCEQAEAEIGALPRAFESASAAERADVVERTNLVYTGMLDELSAIAPVAERDSAMVGEWVSDWRTYVTDRADYANRLRSDEAARFYVSTKSGNQVTNPIDRFARVNGMLACATPSDLS